MKWQNRRLLIRENKTAESIAIRRFSIKLCKNYSQLWKKYGHSPKQMIEIIIGTNYAAILLPTTPNEH